MQSVVQVFVGKELLEIQILSTLEVQAEAVQAPMKAISWKKESGADEGDLLEIRRGDAQERLVVLARDVN